MPACPAQSRASGRQSGLDIWSFSKIIYGPAEKLEASKRGVDPAYYVVEGYGFPWNDPDEKEVFEKTVSYVQVKYKLEGDKKIPNGVVFKVDGSEEFYFAAIKNGDLQVWKFVKDVK